MDEKQRQTEPTTAASSHPFHTRIFVAVAAAAAFLLLRCCWSALPLAGVHPLGPPPTQPAPARIVPLEAHIMSKCPDAKDCLLDLIVPAMQRVSDRVNFTLSFIGSPTENDGVDCLHGPTECLGNVLELCACQLYPEPKISLGFTLCLTDDYAHIPDRDLIEDCALEHAVDFKNLNDCATHDGMHLLRQSVERTTEAGVTTSCTIRLDDEIWCVRDDGQWKDCPHGTSVDELVAAIESLSTA